MRSVRGGTGDFKLWARELQFRRFLPLFPQLPVIFRDVNVASHPVADARRGETGYSRRTAGSAAVARSLGLCVRSSIGPLLVLLTKGMTSPLDSSVGFV